MSTLIAEINPALFLIIGEKLMPDRNMHTSDNDWSELEHCEFYFYELSHISIYFHFMIYFKMLIYLCHNRKSKFQEVLHVSFEATLWMHEIFTGYHWLLRCRGHHVFVPQKLLHPVVVLIVVGVLQQPVNIVTCQVLIWPC